MSNTQIIVIGGGAAGMMAARTAALTGGQVTILERNPKLGRKIYITGKGRCNLTNHCSVQEVLANIPGNSRFVTGAMHRMPPSAVMELFEKLGVPLKTERGNRVFPQSDRAADIIDALVIELRRLKVKIIQDRAVSIRTQDGIVTAVVGEQGTYPCRAVVLATGGASYPLTGSTGDGYTMAEQLGHTVVTPRGSLVPLETQEAFCAAMQGLSLKNVELKVKNSKKKVVYQEQGEMLFTHFGISGPLVLSASACMRSFENEQYTAVIDLKPALDEQKLDARLVREFSERSNQDFQNILGSLVPRLMIPVMVELTGIPGTTKGHEITKAQRRRLLETLKALTIQISGPRPLSDAIVTAGGIKTGEIDPKTMASKKVEGLFFAGEVIDVDAYTGGFNLQIAWATGTVAGECAANYCKAK
ncbi:MAG: NAD(P)/FAD-dependent oxidoreductase [Oscillospiraceae bacterium]|nr:NAD(P)/FAD-dependent oxidoreductase [Oscillospiraceae bacterium]